jgi:hypothetical protein
MAVHFEHDPTVSDAADHDRAKPSRERSGTAGEERLQSELESGERDKGDTGVPGDDCQAIGGNEAGTELGVEELPLRSRSVESKARLRNLCNGEK